MRHWMAAGLIAALIVATPALARDLTTVHQDIVDDYPDVAHLGRAELETLPGALLFDVREADEFAVSHLPGAIRIDPDMDADDFMAAYGALVAGRPVVFYCSVGVRSSRMAERLTPDLSGAQSVWNLRGGAFGWHNDDRAMVNAGGATPFIHPYNRSWGRLVDRSDQLRREP